jgi:hypothetical protein
LDAIKEADVADRGRESATTIYQALIEAELTSVIGGEPHERTEARTAQRNGHRPWTLSTTAGDLQPRIPKLRLAAGRARVRAASTSARAAAFATSGASGAASSEPLASPPSRSRVSDLASDPGSRAPA